jgi:hypothetical protein
MPKSRRRPGRDARHHPSSSKPWRWASATNPRTPPTSTTSSRTIGVDEVAAQIAGFEEIAPVEKALAVLANNFSSVGAPSSHVRSRHQVVGAAQHVTLRPSPPADLLAT